MRNSSYISQYEETLNRLRGMNGTPASQPVPSGALQPTPSSPAAGPLSQPAPATQQGALEPAPMSAADLWRQLPPDQKAEVANSVESSGQSIEGLYSLAVQHGDIPKPEKPPTKEEMLGYLTEVALRTASNMAKSRSGNSFADFADAKLETDERRAALGREESAKAEKRAETMRLEGRADAKEAAAIKRETAREDRTVGRENSREERARAERIAQAEADAKLRRELAEKEIAARREAAKANKPRNQTFVAKDENGNDITYEITGEGQAVPVTTERTDPATGEKKRVAPTVTRKEVDATKAAAIEKSIQKEKEALLDPISPFSREMRAQGYSPTQIEAAAEARARKTVTERYGAAEQIRKPPAPPSIARPLPEGVPAGSTRLGSKAGVAYYRAPDGTTYTSPE